MDDRISNEYKWKLKTGIQKRSKNYLRSYRGILELFSIMLNKEFIKFHKYKYEQVFYIMKLKQNNDQN